MTAESNTLWRLLLPRSVPVFRVSEHGEAWSDDLSRLLDHRSVDEVVVVADRPLARALLAMVSSADRPQSSHPSVRTVVEAITAHGASIREAYDLWPSATDPGLAYPRRAPLVRKWIQRSGFLGVGGRSIWVRAAVRSPLLTPLLKLLTPAVALVIEARREAA